MSEIQLTKDAERLLALMYRAYMQRRKVGTAKLQAKQMGDINAICKEFLPNENPVDVLETCRELSRMQCLSALWASNRIIRSSLTDTAIVYMENRFKNGLADLARFLSQFIP